MLSSSPTSQEDIRSALSVTCNKRAGKQASQRDTRKCQAIPKYPRMGRSNARPRERAFGDRGI